MKTNVVYTLTKFGSSFVKPPEIFDGGRIWKHGPNIRDTLFLGKINLINGEKLPEGVVKEVSDSEVETYYAAAASEKIKSIKRKIFSEKCDPLLFQAIRERELGDNTKWEAYLIECEKVKALTLKDIG